MSQASNDVQIALLNSAVKVLMEKVLENKLEAESDLRRVKEEAEEEIQRVREKAEFDARANAASIAALEDERTKALKWGVMTLGTAVMGMACWIFDKVISGSIR
jgi:NCAIR mutase (PurE)-related protein